MTRAARLMLAVAGALVVLSGMPAAASAALSWTGPMAADTAGNGPGLGVLGCVSTTSCTALTGAGGRVDFNPQAVVPANPTAVDPGIPTAMSCPAVGHCVAVDGSGNELPIGWGSRVTIDSGQVLSALTCISATSCVAVDTNGSAVAFNPSTGQHTSYAIDSGHFLTAIGCPAANECASVDANRRETSFDPTSGSVTAITTLPNTSGTTTPPAPTTMSCISTTQCIAFDTKGVAVLFDPHQPSNTTSTQFDRGQEIVASDCESTSECTVIDAAGGELTSPPPGQNAGANQPTRHVVDATQTLTGLSCPAGNQCVVVNGEGKAISFDPTTGQAGTPALTDAIPAYAVVACSGPAQCTGADRSGDIVTFDPQTRAVLASGAVDPSTQLVTAMTCPSATECTLVDLDGREASFNPRAPGTVSGKQLVTGHPLLAVSCPSASQCTTVDDDRDEITFNPAAPGGATFALLNTPAGTSITGVSCPTTGQCTAVDGAGEAVTFNPAAPGSPKPTTVLPGGAADVNCPATGECVAVDPSGGQAVFDPATPALVHASTIDTGEQTTGLACLTGTFCVITDSAGHAVEFDPHGFGPTTSPSVGSPASVTGVACPSGTECVAVDTGGHAYAAHGTLPALPVGTSSPAIRGRAEQAVRLTTTNGGWTNAPTSYAIQWQRCTAHAKGCHDIAGATLPSYRLATADVGHRLRVRVLAANQAGYSDRAKYSRLTRLVVSRPMPPTVSRLTLSPSAFGVTLTAARYGPRLHTLLITLPAGVRFTPRHVGRGLDVTSGGRRVRATARIAGGRLRVALPRSVRTLRIVLHAPSFTLSSALSHRLRARRVSELTLRVALSGPGSHNLRTTKRWKAK